MRIVMTFMPELIAFFDSFIGLVAILIGFENFFCGNEPSDIFALSFHRFKCYFGTFIKVFTFTGSLIVYTKLSAKLSSKPLIIGQNFRHVINSSVLVISAISMVCYMIDIGCKCDLVQLGLGAALSGFFAASGLMLSNLSLVCSNALVESSGVILSYTMCHSMNSSFIANVQSIIFVLWYGMAAEKAQNAVAAIIKFLRKHGCWKSKLIIVL
ncbi:MAG: putative pyridine nucleotide transhydrogenase [Streblomastix strix]|uniref:Putative pyridine nucleotide transhydrogenase n=1 Tax=Streblomastix strix TaxID=222440 RepID=A0A5J4VLF6_9EUKA|nr:MAG: putative pyridine nucleotide transhydrogenase [Streblomastix strix]